MTTRTVSREQLLHDIFVTALEGGIGYWSRAEKYRWSTPETRRTKHPLPDLKNFEAVIVDEDDKTYTINAEVIELGLTRMMSQDFKVNKTILGAVALANITNEADQVDAEVADCIVQAGLFNEIVFG